MMKYVFVSLALLLLPIVNAHLLLGSWVPETSDQVPIENHLSGKALRALETVVDDEAEKHCQESACEKSVFGYFRQMVGFLRGRVD